MPTKNRGRHRPRILDQVTASFDRMHAEHVEQQWVRHGEFVAQLRDPNFAQAVVAAALKHVDEWEAGNEPSAQSSGWRAVLGMEPELIAAVLEENAHPILHIRHGQSPFWRDLSEAEDRQLREETAHFQVQKKPAESSHDKCRLSVDEMSNWLYRIVMSDTDFSHPGALVRQNCLERFELSVTECARALGVSRQALTNLLGGKAGISPEMALRLDLAFGGGAETWLQRQLLHDLSEARKRLAQFKVVPIASERQPALF